MHSSRRKRDGHAWSEAANVSEAAAGSPGLDIPSGAEPIAAPRWRSLRMMACPAVSLRRVSDLPADERPRERLARQGASALSNRELLALLVGCVAPGESALDVAEHLLGDGLRSLAGRSLPEIESLRGLGRAKASRILAALELGSRLASGEHEPARVLLRPEDAAAYLIPRYSHRPVETFGVLALDVRHRLRHELVISVGCLTGSLVHPREVFNAAVAHRAAGLLLFHNHPSGDPEPSAEDLSLTRRLAAAGTLLGIEVVDHLVLGDGRYVSLKARGVL